MLSLLPVKKLSMQITWSPRRTRYSQRWLPTKPAPPGRVGGKQGSMGALDDAISLQGIRTRHQDPVPLDTRLCLDDCGLLHQTKLLGARRHSACMEQGASLPPQSARHNHRAHLL